MTSDLTDQAGLTIGVEPATGRLHLGREVISEDSAVCDVASAREVYAEPGGEDQCLYYMENGLQIAGEGNPDPYLRYELTSLRPGLAGPESVKTIGHVHAPVVHGLGHPELYEVLFGSAAFPLFRPRERACGGWECVIVEATRGERFMIPPGWHHLAVNVGEEAMVFADIVARGVVPDDTVPRKFVGGPLRFAGGEVGRNPSYGVVGSVARVRASDLPMPVYLDRGLLWPQFTAASDDFGCLLQPAITTDTWRVFDERVAAAAVIPLATLEPIE
jgi:oxalate decarboxylase/phosphoglucose isomerase-like protein (cupin superfamily)